MRKISFLILGLSLISRCGFGDIGSGSSGKIISIQPLSHIVTEGRIVTLSVKVKGSAPFNYKWYKDSAEVGTDSPNLVIDTSQGSYEGNYTVVVSNPSGRETSEAVIVTAIPASLSDRSFTLGVWLQASEKILNGKTKAQNYKDIGINTYIGLWKWPHEEGMYPGYAIASMKALQDAGIVVYAGNDKAAVDWIRDHPEFNDTFAGYLLGDEPDMNRNSGIPEQADANTPAAWKAAGDALIALDNTRSIYANFGKPFSKDVWNANSYGSTGSKESDFECYVLPTTVMSSDFYGITDPYELPANHGIWTYGRAVDNTLKYATLYPVWKGASRPAWGFVEASAPWKTASSKNWMYQRMPPHLIKPIVWNMVVHGAMGILYFCHDFSPSGGKGALSEPGIPEAINAANESVMAFGSVLKTASITGTTVSTDGPVNVAVLTKKFNGDTYIFAMGDGNSKYRDGYAVRAVISVAGESGNRSVEVMNDSRTVQMINGKITDDFGAYELHIYKINH